MLARLGRSLCRLRVIFIDEVRSTMDEVFLWGGGEIGWILKFSLALGEEKAIMLL